MTREEITQKASELSEQIREFGKICFDQHWKVEDVKDRAVLYLLAEFCHHAGFQLDSFTIYTNR